MMVYAVLILDLRLSACRSLKEKRGNIKPILNRLHKEFNVSSAEIEKNDSWNESVIACGLITNEKKAADAQLNQILHFMENHWRNIDIINYSITYL